MLLDFRYLSEITACDFTACGTLHVCLFGKWFHIGEESLFQSNLFHTEVRVPAWRTVALLSGYTGSAERGWINVFLLHVLSLMLWVLASQSSHSNPRYKDICCELKICI